MKIRKWKWFLIPVAVVALLMFGGAYYVVNEVNKISYMPGVPYVPPFIVPSEQMTVDPKKNIYEQTRVVEIAGRTFEFPVMFIDSPPSKKRVLDSILLEVIWPDMKGIWEIKSVEDYDRIIKQERRIGWILIQRANMRPSPDVSLASRQRSLTKDEYVGEVYELEKYHWYRGIPEDPRVYYHGYIENDSYGNATSWIECRRGLSTRFPTCSHHFTDQGLLYKISYNEAAFLPEWQEMKRRAIAFMRRFEITPDHHNKNLEPQ